MLAKRQLGRSGIEVSALGFGCWPIGGQIIEDGKSVGWHDVDDRESVRALQRAFELGVTFYDTADVYGRSEELLARAFSTRRDEVVIASKFGKTYDRSKHEITGQDLSPQHMRRALEGSLQRLQTDVIDLYQLHIEDCSADIAVALREELDELVREGKIRGYGWSTDNLENASLFAEGAHCAAVQHHLNLLEGNRAIARLCELQDLASINRGPLAMGLLTGKYGDGSRLPDDDVRGAGHAWMWLFPDGRPRADYLDRLASVREILTAGGRTLTQGALAWIWGFSPVTVPIPGFRTLQQAEENARALEFGPLAAEQMAEIHRILAVTA